MASPWDKSHSDTTYLPLPASAAAASQASVSPAGLSLSTASRAEAFTHDARNLLTALGLYADLLGAPGVLPLRFQHYAGELRLLADRSSSLLGRVLVPEQDEEPPARRVRQEPLCDPAAVLRRFHPLLQAQAEGAASVVLHVPRSTPPLPVSGEALERIVVNLVCNAVEAIRLAAAGGVGGAAPHAQASALPTPPTVWIRLDVRDDAVRLFVEDSGPGMAPDVAASFAHGERMEFASCSEGRGWGHRIVHALVSETGGRVAVRPRSGGGTVVTVRWPLSSPASVRVYRAEILERHGRIVEAC